MNTFRVLRGWWGDVSNPWPQTLGPALSVPTPAFVQVGTATPALGGHTGPMDAESIHCLPDGSRTLLEREAAWVQEVGLG